MQKRLQGTILGILASLGGVLLWVIIGLFGIISGWAAFLMGWLFSVVYKKVAPEDKSAYRYVMLFVVMIAEIFLSEMVFVALLVSVGGAASIGAFFADAANLAGFFVDVGVGVVFGVIAAISIVASDIRREKNIQAIAEQERLQAERAAALLQEQLSEQPAAETETGADAEAPRFTSRKVTLKRKKTFIAMAVKINIFCDDVLMASDVKSGQEVTFEVSSAAHTLHCKYANFGANYPSPPVQIPASEADVVGEIVPNMHAAAYTEFIITLH
ncbi:MAG: hypothetical protein J6Z36_03435 [Clostridia bacterium]|nr:hypothetical protein [Clostridia bacterium]